MVKLLLLLGIFYAFFSLGAARSVKGEDVEMYVRTEPLSGSTPQENGFGEGEGEGEGLFLDRRVELEHETDYPEPGPNPRHYPPPNPRRS